MRTEPFLIATSAGTFEAETLSAAQTRAMAFVREHHQHVALRHGEKTLFLAWWDKRQKTVESTFDKDAIAHFLATKEVPRSGKRSSASLWLGKHPASISIEIHDRYRRYPHFEAMLQEYVGLIIPPNVTVRWVPIGTVAVPIPVHSADQAAKERAFIDDLARRMQEGEDLPPLFLRREKIHDGRHRALAAMKNGLRFVPVVDIDPFWDERAHEAIEPEPPFHGPWTEGQTRQREVMRQILAEETEKQAKQRRGNPKPTYEVAPGVVLTETQTKALYEIRQAPRSVWEYGSTTIHRLRKEKLIETRDGKAYALPPAERQENPLSTRRAAHPPQRASKTVMYVNDRLVPENVRGAALQSLLKDGDMIRLRRGGRNATFRYRARRRPLVRQAKKGRPPLANGRGDVIVETGHGFPNITIQIWRGEELLESFSKVSWPLLEDELQDNGYDEKKTTAWLRDNWQDMIDELPGTRFRGLLIDRSRHASPRGHNPVSDRAGEREENEEREERQQKEAEKKLTAAFGRHQGLNADWNAQAWFVAGEGGYGNHAEHAVWVYDEEDGTFCVYERTYNDEAEQGADIEEIFCASAADIEIVIAQAIFHGARLIGGGNDRHQNPRALPSGEDARRGPRNSLGEIISVWNDHGTLYAVRANADGTHTYLTRPAPFHRQVPGKPGFLEHVAQDWTALRREDIPFDVAEEL